MRMKIPAVAAKRKAIIVAFHSGSNRGLDASAGETSFLRIDLICSGFQKFALSGCVKSNDGTGDTKQHTCADKLTGMLFPEWHR
jgi:hypothetical protein